MLHLVVENLVIYLALSSALILVGSVFGMLLRREDPRAQLLHWQLLLIACLLLPLLGKWQTPSPVSSDVTVRIGVATAAPLQTVTAAMDWEMLALMLMGAGSLILMLRILLGLYQLRLYRQRSVVLEDAHAEALSLISGDVGGPVTFGFLRPVILLPTGFLELPESIRHSILAHELAHIRRGDWLFALAEESIRSLLWFHPGIWFVLSRIHLTREQVVDQEAVRATGQPGTYLNALLHIAGVKPRLDLIPAAPFLTRRHLARRVAILLHEVSPMTRSRLFGSLAVSASILFLAGLAATVTFPFHAPAQTVQGVAEATTKSGSQAIHKAPTRYPAEAKLKRIQGDVILEASIDAKGLVTEARVLSGPEELRRAAVQSLMQWQFTATGAPARAEVTINFRLGKVDPPQGRETLGVLRSIDYAEMPAELRGRIPGVLPLKIGDAVTFDAAREIQSALAEVDSRLRASISEDMALTISLAANGIRVGGNLQAAKIKNKVTPKYPPEAKAARIQGTVRMNVEIDAAGKVSNVELVAGHPILVPAAMDAVRQWEYETTLLNGNPVAVLTVVDVNFTLSK
ncbi:MAG: M56 family metallopeptidase [Candidatus Solibacter usitatus]|nr:M56 family metallopeptidase [Candidatus Solibacter usitatus]